MLNHLPQMQLKLFQKQQIQKTASDLLGNNISHKITKLSRNSAQNNSEIVESKTEIPKQTYISPQKR